MKGLFEMTSPASWAMLGVALVLFLLLVISFRSRAYVFCQYLKTMAGISLRPRDVRAAFKRGNKEGVRELFLDLIIREDLKSGPIPIPDDLRKK
jgi:hypothetical protein